MDRAERGEVIMEAAETRYGRDELNFLTVAMGLTPDEADQWEIDWR